ncbi:hypothetical protein A7Q10_07590 [Methylacidiphilum caldifontis]|uniref:Uncharacterized protein n=1 Tax=Methylacidiphilum caldifontis TaxID=2795386 RepID=A0A4Y8PCH6_9BACT|nr:hypothetical protein A7Q10_07590 [Methylacidiphilum caldifontis]
MGVDRPKQGRLGPPVGQCFALIEERQGFLLLNPAPAAFIHRRVPQQAMHPAQPLQRLDLAQGGIQSIGNFTMHHGLNDIGLLWKNNH